MQTELLLAVNTEARMSLGGGHRSKIKRSGGGKSGGYRIEQAIGHAQVLLASMLLRHCPVRHHHLLNLILHRY